MKNKIYNPDPLAKWGDKIKDSYGLSIAYMISKDWFNGGYAHDDCEYATRKNWVTNKRLVARGEQSVEKYKEHISRQDGDLTYLNLDWRIINIPGKFCRVVSNGIKDDYYLLDIRANDRLTLQRKKDKMDEHRKNMRTLPLLKNTKEQLGLDLIPKGFIPEDDEELKLYSEIKDRPKIEIAEEITIEYIKKINNYQFVEDTKNKDLVEVGASGCRVWTDPTEGVKLQYVDPEYLIHSHVDKNDFSDAHYYGYIDNITLDDIKRESGFDDNILREIAESYSVANARTANWQTCDVRDLLDYKVDVMRFAYKTSKTIVYKQHKKKGVTVKLSEKDEDYNPPERNDYGKLSSVRDTWMEGSYVVGSEYIYKYQECENIVRDEQNNPLPPFIIRASDIYQNRLRSFLDDIEPLSDQMQYIHLKVQHLVAELKPDLVELDLDSLADLPTKGKKQETWETALNIMGVKGVVFTKRVDMGEMGIKDKPGTRPIPVNQGSGLTVLLNTWAHYYNLIRDTTGVNPARDGSLPHDALLGVNEMAQLASNTATQHIVDASIDFNKRVCETISTRVHAIFSSKNAGHLQKMYEKAVGKQNIEALETMKDRHLHDFGFTVELTPTAKEMQDFREDLAISLQDGSIDVEIKSEAQQVAKVNMKLATQYLFYMRKKRRKQMLEEKMLEAKNKSQNDIQSAQAAVQGKIQSYGMEKKMDLQYEAQMVKIRITEKRAELEIEAPENDKKFKQDVFLKSLDTAKEYNMKDFLENRKDSRTKIQATQQSKMKAQEGPIDFENEDVFGDIFGSN